MESHELHVVLHRKSVKEWPWFGLRMACTRAGANKYVDTLEPGSPAASCLKEFDKVVTLDGTCCTKLSPKKTMSLIKGAGLSLQLKIERREFASPLQVRTHMHVASRQCTSQCVNSAHNHEELGVHLSGTLA